MHSSPHDNEILAAIVNVSSTSTIPMKCNGVRETDNLAVLPVNSPGKLTFGPTLHFDFIKSATFNGWSVEKTLPGKKKMREKNHYFHFKLLMTIKMSSISWTKRLQPFYFFIHAFLMFFNGKCSVPSSIFYQFYASSRHFQHKEHSIK